LDFVKFYIVQVFKSAASRIRLADKEKEKLLSRLVSKVENSRDLFPDLKEMERVTELEETAAKLISIYRRLNKSHIDLEKISYQFVSDRDAIQSILRRFLQGNYRSGIVSRKRPKIVFDDTTFTIYELKETDVTAQEEKLHEQTKEPKIDINEFLKDEKEDIVAIKKEDSENQNQILETNSKKSSSENEITSQELEKTEIEEGLEINNGIAKRSIAKKIEVKEKEPDNLVLPLQFEEEGLSAEVVPEEDQSTTSVNYSSINGKQKFEKEEKEILNLETKGKDDLETISPQDEDLNKENLNEVSGDTETIEDLNEQEIESNLVSEDESKNVDVQNFENNILNTFKIVSTDTLFLDFEKLILQNILEVDEFLKKALDESFNENENLKLIQDAYKCFELAKELDYQFISELIKVYWLALVALQDHKIVLDKSYADLIRNTLIVLVSLIKSREIDLEPFMKKHNSLKQILQHLQYEV
jgi:hypothetical protein